MLCPHEGCQRELKAHVSDAWTEGGHGDGDRFTITCPGCKRPVDVDVGLTVDFDVNVPDDYEEENDGI